MLTLQATSRGPPYKPSKENPNILINGQWMNQQKMQCNFWRSCCGIDEDSNELIPNFYKS